MAVKVITDSTSDLPSDIIADLNISIVPIYVRFGENIYRHGIDISDDEFYARIQTSPVHPATSQPPRRILSGFTVSRLSNRSR
jgi:fatty acid-binding protein DegV